MAVEEAVCPAASLLGWRQMDRELLIGGTSGGGGGGGLREPYGVTEAEAQLKNEKAAGRGEARNHSRPGPGAPLLWFLLAGWVEGASATSFRLSVVLSLAHSRS